MKRGTLIEDMLIAVTLTALTFPLLCVFGIFGIRSMTPYLTVGVLAAIFICYLLRKSKARVGRITSLLLVFGLLTLGAFRLDFTAFLLLAVMLIWAVRSVLSYSSFVMSGVDLGLTLGAFILAWYVHYTLGGMLLAVWIFFLLQGFARFIPQRIPSPAEQRSTPVEDPFERAYVSAESALRRVIKSAAA